MFTDKQNAELKKKLHPDNVKKHPFTGMSYIEGWKAIEEANRIFGFSWNRETIYCKEVSRYEYEIKNKGTGWKVGYEAKVRITIGDVVKEGTGHGSGTAKDLFDCMEGAAKEAETDAMKRAFMTLGYPFGLALYDKQQANVGIEPKFEYTMEHRVTQRDFLYGLSKCNAVDGLESYMEAWDSLKDVPVEVSGNLKDEYENRLNEIPKGVKFPAPRFDFINVSEATNYMGEAGSAIDEATDGLDLGLWVQENDHKIKALDITLKADKYQKDGSPPSQRVMKKYNDKIAELKGDNSAAA